MSTYKDYLKAERLPHKWCAGCSNGIVLNACLRAIADMNINKDDIVFVSGSGCLAKCLDYPDCSSIKFLHGRGLAGATGIAMSNPKLKVFCLLGDGDCTTIGGNHLIHCARRNLNLTVILCNNFNYGMTGGQYSGTTPEGSITTTSKYGLPEKGFDSCSLVAACGAPYVARTTAYDVIELRNYIKEATQKKGFGFIEVLAACPVHFGRWNKMGDAAAMLLDIKNKTVRIEKAKNMSQEELKDLITVGKFVDIEKEDYYTRYDDMRKKAKQ